MDADALRFFLAFVICVYLSEAVVVSNESLHWLYLNSDFCLPVICVYLCSSVVSILLQRVVLFPAFTRRVLEQCIRRVVVGDLVCVPIELQLSTQPLRQASQCQHLRQRT